MGKAKYNEDVFINCPFDRHYKRIFNAIVFAVFDCGFRVRCAQEIIDASEIRIDNITKIVRECKFGIHDISRTSLDLKNNLPRFNMPLELGIFIGAKRFGNSQQKSKVCLILDKDEYRYQKFISDISGQDIFAHHKNPESAIRIVRNWLSPMSSKLIPGPTEMIRRYNEFKLDLPLMCKETKRLISELTFNDYAQFISIWIEIKP